MAGCDVFSEDLINLALSSKASPKSTDGSSPKHKQKPNPLSNLLSSPETTMRGDTLRGDMMRSDTMWGDTMRGDTNRGDTNRGDTKRGDTKRGDAPSRFPRLLVETQRMDSNFMIRTGSIQPPSVSDMKKGALLEVYSKTKNEWSICRLKSVKGNAVRVIYGNQNKQRWVRLTQCRPFCPQAAYTPGVHSEEFTNLKTSSMKNTSEISGERSLEPSTPRSIVSVQTIRGPLSGADNAERGELRIRVNGAMELKNEGNYATVTVSGVKLRTVVVKSDHHPIWNDALVFSHFRPDSSKFATVKVKKTGPFGSVVIGEARFRLPTRFDHHKTMVLKLLDSGRNSMGIVSLEHTVIKK